MTQPSGQHQQHDRAHQGVACVDDLERAPQQPDQVVPRAERENRERDAMEDALQIRRRTHAPEDANPEGKVSTAT